MRIMRFVRRRPTIHALTDQRESSVRIRLTAGQAGDNSATAALLDDYRHASTGKIPWASTDFRLPPTRPYHT